MYVGFRVQMFVDRFCKKGEKFVWGTSTVDHFCRDTRNTNASHLASLVEFVATCLRGPGGPGG